MRRYVQNNQYYYINGKKDHFTTWVNNSKWSWIIPLALLLLSGLVENIKF